MHTFIRNKDTPRDEFIFYSKRLIRLVIEYALSLLPFQDIIVDTPQGFPYQGVYTINEELLHDYIFECSIHLYLCRNKYVLAVTLYCKI